MSSTKHSTKAIKKPWYRVWYKATLPQIGGIAFLILLWALDPKGPHYPMAIVIGFNAGIIFETILKIKSDDFRDQIDAIKDKSFDLAIKSAESMKIRHGDKLLAYDHFRGVTEKAQKFVYCPKGRIISWSAGDYDNRWCPWCKEYYEGV